MTINIGRRQFIAVLGSVAAARPLAANAAVAPEYRWESAAPSIVLVAPEGVGGHVILKSLAMTMDCGHDCVVASSYLLASAQAQSVQVAVLSGEPSNLRIQLQGRPVTTSPARAADPATLDRIGVPVLQQSGLSAVAVTLPLAAGQNEITVVEHVSLSTRGRGTNAVVRAVEIIPAPLRGWNLAPEFTFSPRLGYGSELLTDLKAAGLKDEPIMPLCVRYGSDRDPSTVSLGTVEGSGGREYFTANFDRDFPAALSWQIGNAAAARYWN
jgi:hypothetical protein